jgi:hypothetical protein
MPNKRKSAVNDKPFNRNILSKARRRVEDYRFAFWREDGRFIGQCVEMDTLGTGKTVEACIAEAKALAVTGAAYMLESAKRPPLPARSQRRNLQVNIRLSPDEKTALEQAASNGGFRGVSDYLRIRGLSAS